MPTALGFSIGSTILALLDRLNLNFFRVHLLWFTLNPLIWSGIFYACNGQFHIAYIDSLFLCMSAQTVTGLSTVNASTLTGFQQAILYFLMATGNYTITSYVMVLVRKHYFVAEVLKSPRSRIHFRDMASRTAKAIRSKTMDVVHQFPDRFPRVLSTQSNTARQAANPIPITVSIPERKEGTMQQLHPLVKVESAPEPRGRTVLHDVAQSSPKKDIRVSDESTVMSESRQGGPSSPVDATPSLRGSVRTNLPRLSPALGSLGEPLYRTESPSAMSEVPTLRRHPTISSSIRRRAPGPSPLRRGTIFSNSQMPATTAVPAPGPRRQGTGLLFQRKHDPENNGDHAQNGGGVPLTYSLTVPTNQDAPYEKGFGGFSAKSLASKLASKIAPDALGKLERKLTLADGVAYIPSHQAHRAQNDMENAGRTPEINEDAALERGRPARSHRNRDNTATSFPPMTNSESQPLPRIPSVSDDASSETDWADEIEEGAKNMWKKSVSYIKEGVLWVGRNSAFRIDDLTDDQIEELGGVEYRALRALSWILGFYFIGTQLATFTIITSYLSSTKKYDSIFDSQPRYVPKAWFAAFQCMSAYTGGGLTLVDQGMVPFRAAYVIVISQGMLIIAGNMGFPILLRLTLWLLSKMVPADHRAPLQFLLDHPRRCFLYLFPSHQTWFLVVVFLILSIIEWFSFLALDAGLESVESIKIGERVLAGLFQSVSVRASGFAIVALGALAPAVKFLYMVMMYISAYPIAMSLRSTNVYEQRSLGIWEDVPNGDEADSDADPDTDERLVKKYKGNRGEILFSKYLGMHVRRQLSFDIWWLAFAMWLILIIERGQVMAKDNEDWFNIFSVLFEIVSAYSTVGLSLGVATDNYSFCGSWKPLSKFILCAVMLRGRHRDLPVAIDRAILLPVEFSRNRTDEAGHHIISPIAETTNNILQPEGQTVPEKSPPVTTFVQEAGDKPTNQGVPFARSVSFRSDQGRPLERKMV